MTRTITNIIILSILLAGLLTFLHAPRSTTAHVSLNHITAGPSLNHITVGFSIDSLARVDNAARSDVDTAIIYGKAFTPSDPVGAEMQAKGMTEIDAGISSELFYYECHRTHTVAPPRKGTSNTVCATDEKPWINSESVVLSDVNAMLKADAVNPLIRGYWVLDDWVLWDAGSAKTILQAIHNHIQQYTPSYPAICGFGLAIVRPNSTTWNPRIAQNYSNAGCDMVGIYSYVSTYPSAKDGSQFDFTMKTALAAAFQSLRQLGWSIHNTPLLGIGQAFAGPYGRTRYEPGITSTQMTTQAKAFCKAGATSIGWYAWDDSGFGAKTLTPMTSAEVQDGITSSMSACQAVWEGQ